MRYESDYLVHYGVKGQKWGIRQYQNPDGTLTAAGKAHYGKGGEGSDKNTKSGKNSANKEGVREVLNTVSQHSNVIRPALMIARKIHRTANATKEVKESGLNDEKERVTKKNINSLGNYNRKERKEILDRMKDNPEMSFKDAKRPTMWKKVGKEIAKSAAVTAAMILAPKAIRAMNNSPRFAQFKNWARHAVMKMTMKNVIWAKPGDYSISEDRPVSTEPQRRLTAG